MVSCCPEIHMGGNKCVRLYPIQVLPLREEELRLRAAGASGTDPRWLSPKQGTGSAGAGRALGWSPSSAATVLGTERARSFLSGHPLPPPHCPWGAEKAGPWWAPA